MEIGLRRWKTNIVKMLCHSTIIRIYDKFWVLEGGFIMGYVTDAKYTGGSIGGRGFSFQDKVAVKYIFEYFDDGIKEVSLETLNDFCIVFDNGEKMYCQVKRKQITPGFIKSLINGVELPKTTVFIGAGFNDDFRNLVETKERYLNLKNGCLVDDKENLYEDLKKDCNRYDLDVEAFLDCEFDELSTAAADVMAKGFIDKWARERKKFIDTDNLYNHLLVLCDKKRAVGGAFSKEEIDNVIRNHRTSKITSYIENQERVSVVVEEQCKNEIEKLLDEVIFENVRFEKELTLIKIELLSEKLVEAKNHIEEVLIYIPELKPLYYMILNNLGLHDDVISEIDDDNENPNCLFEYAKAYYIKRDFANSQKFIEKIDKKQLDSNVLCISGTNNRMMGNTEKAIQDLEVAIKIDRNNVDAYLQLAELFYYKDMDRAVSYCAEALKIDEKYPNVYLVRADICEINNDFKGVVENLNKYLFLSNDENNDEILLKIAIYSYCAEIDKSGFLFFKWNQAYRANQRLSDTRVIEYPNPFGSIGGYRFKLITKETRVIVHVNGDMVFSIQTTGEYSRTGVGLYVDPINFQMYEFISRAYDNPLDKSEDAICRKASIPALYKIYEDKDAFKNVYEQLKANSAVHLNHEYDNYIEEYIVDEDEVDINISVYGRHFTGYAKIGDVRFNLDINPLMNDAYERFREKLEKDEDTIEAALILMHGEECLVQYTFKKGAINVRSE